jgi:hypothetical protein
MSMKSKALLMAGMAAALMETHSMDDSPRLSWGKTSAPAKPELSNKQKKSRAKSKAARKARKNNR